MDEIREILFIQRKDTVVDSLTTPSPTNDRHDGELTKRDKLPVKGKGVLRQALLVADSTDFRVRLEIDDDNIIDESHQELASFSNELTNISAYTREKTNDAVFSVSDYPFTEWLDFSVAPTEGDLNFKLVRVEAEIERQGE